ncbi:Protein LONGIFOLIA 1 [Bienertia sinuspersici]
MKDNWKMEIGKNESSVLAKLMGIDKPSPPYTTPRRHRVLSENYLHNIALVAKREKSLSYSDDSDFNMDVIEGSVECSQGAGVLEHQDFLSRSGQSCIAGRSFSSSNSSLSDRKRTKSVIKQYNGVFFLDSRRNNSFCSSKKSPVQGSLASQEIAKQVTGQVMHSVWHSCAEFSRSRPSTEKSPEIVEDEKMTKEHEASSSNLLNRSCTGRKTPKSRKELMEKWRTRKSSQDEMLVTSSGNNCSTPFFTANVNGWPVHAGRYLSKSALFPSAWVPRSRARDFSLDKSWCLKPGKRDSKQGDVSVIFKDTLKVGQENSSEKTVTESLSDTSSLSELGSLTNHKVHKIRNENGGCLEKDVSRDRTVECYILNCNLAPLSLETGENADEEIKNKNMPTKIWKESLSAKQATCILLGDRESWKHQANNKGNTSEPGSPVSSLEGPEACRHILNFTVEEAEENLAVTDSLESGTHGLQRKLQLIENMSLESGSEGPGMLLSSEEGDDISSVNWNLKDPQIMEFNQTSMKESCDFSYIVDIIVESGLHMKNMEIESKTWALQGYALHRSVFDSLEKKYGKQIPSEKSERMLLFDCINSVLLEMFKPYIGLSSWRKPTAKRLSQKSQELIEDKVWWLLVNQQEEYKKSYDNDKLSINEMEWLDLEEDTSLIVQEIQSLLIDGVVEEFVCMEMCFC